MSKFAVVILTRTVPNLVACSLAVRQNEPGLPAERIVVVDDDETFGVAKYCEVHGFTRVDGEKPFVFARNANIGLAVAFATADVAILLNDDALLLTPGGFGQLTHLLDLDPKMGLLSPATDNVGNTNQNSQRCGWIRPEHRMLCFVCVAVPRRTRDIVGPLDEQFTGYGFDDDDYSYRTRLAGFRLGVWDRVRVDHSTLRSTFRGTAYPVEGFEHNRRLFTAKHGG